MIYLLHGDDVMASEEALRQLLVETVPPETLDLALTRLDGAGLKLALPCADLDPQSWHHFLVSWDASEGGRAWLLIDGEGVSGAMDPPLGEGPPIPCHKLYLGGGYFADLTTEFTGSVDDLHVSDQCVARSRLQGAAPEPALAGLQVAAPHPEATGVELGHLLRAAGRDLRMRRSLAGGAAVLHRLEHGGPDLPQQGGIHRQGLIHALEHHRGFLPLEDPHEEIRRERAEHHAQQAAPRSHMLRRREGEYPLRWGGEGLARAQREAAPGTGAQSSRNRPSWAARISRG